MHRKVLITKDNAFSFGVNTLQQRSGLLFRLKRPPRDASSSCPKLPTLATLCRQPCSRPALRDDSAQPRTERSAVLGTLHVQISSPSGAAYVGDVNNYVVAPPAAVPFSKNSSRLSVCRHERLHTGGSGAGALTPAYSPNPNAA